MLQWLSRVFSKDLRELTCTEEPDPAVDALVARSVAAQESIVGWPEGKIDGLITALATEIAATRMSLPRRPSPRQASAACPTRRTRTGSRA